MFYSPSNKGFYAHEIHGDSMPADVVEFPDRQHSELLAGQAIGLCIEVGNDGGLILVPAQPPSIEQMQAAFTAAIQNSLDEFAMSRGYDGILSACTYASSSVAKFAAEGRRAVDMRDQTWAAAYVLLAQVQAGTRAMPASLADIEDDLPKLEWQQ
ncbi:MAG: hypothetical protein DCF26_09335 [Burkholderiales bacterium]|nr:MAG: hypothetical protein DCF26_09335 [Burkholderiales bacterium]